MLPWMLRCMYRCFIFFRYILRSGTAVSHCSSVFSYFSQWLHQFTFPPTVHKGSLFSTSSPTFVCVSFLMKTILTGARWYSNFDLHFPDDEWCWSSFHVSFGHLHLLFGKVSDQFFCPFFNWVLCFLMLSCMRCLYMLDINL